MKLKGVYNSFDGNTLPYPREYMYFYLFILLIVQLIHFSVFVLMC
jgi:hypothetical protein